MRFSKIISLIISISIAISSTAFASGSVLGSLYINGYSQNIGKDAYFCNNTYLSDQNGVGLQTENYIVYSPNSAITPMVSYGEKVYGNLVKTINDGNRLINEGYDIIGGINADYFSLQTGVPMSNLVIDGEVITKDSSASYGFGIDEDGNGFTGESYIAATLIRADGRTLNIECINKYRQPYLMYLMNSKFSDQTHNTTLGLDIILDVDSDEVRIGETIKGTVTYAQCYEGSIKIPEGSIVLTVDEKAPMFKDIADIAVGEEVEIEIVAPTEPRWETATFGMGSTGEYILSNGEVTPDLPSGTHPRTAVGITEDKEIVFYTIDGRQTGYSFGVRLETLAKRMKELGCVEAINLDGGGSTSIVAKLPGDNGITLMNKPSDGGSRAVATNFFIANNLKKTGDIGQLLIYPSRTPYILKGSKMTLSAKACDTGYHPMNISGDVKFEVEKGKKSEINNNGEFLAKDIGKVEVSATYQGVETTKEIVCVESPMDIAIVKKGTKDKIDVLKIKRNDKIELKAVASYGYQDLIYDEDCFEWSLSENVGEIDENGKITASNSIGASGILTVSAGEKEKEITVFVLPDGNEDEELLYSVIDAEISDGALIGEISNEYRVDVQKENLKITFDGKETDFEYDGKEFKAEIGEDVKKIRITATNDLEYTSVKSLINENGVIYENPFVDTDTSWAKDIPSYMYAQKLVSGEMSEAGLIYNPQKEMSRAEFAVLICNFLKVDTAKYESYSVPYTDIEEIPKWALNQFKALYDLKILTGRDDGMGGVYADSKTGISRAEAFTVIARLLPKGLKKTEVIGADADKIPSWATAGFGILMADGTVSGYEDGTLRPLNKLTKAEAAKLLYSLY